MGKSKKKSSQKWIKNVYLEDICSSACHDMHVIRETLYEIVGSICNEMKLKELDEFSQFMIENHLLFKAEVEELNYDIPLSFTGKRKYPILEKFNSYKRQTLNHEISSVITTFRYENLYLIDRKYMNHIDIKNDIWLTIEGIEYAPCQIIGSCHNPDNAMVKFLANFIENYEINRTNLVNIPIGINRICLLKCELSLIRVS